MDSAPLGPVPVRVNRRRVKQLSAVSASRCGAVRQHVMEFKKSREVVFSQGRRQSPSALKIRPNTLPDGHQMIVIARDARGAPHALPSGDEREEPARRRSGPRCDARRARRPATIGPCADHASTRVVNSSPRSWPIALPRARRHVSRVTFPVRANMPQVRTPLRARTTFSRAESHLSHLIPPNPT